MESFSSELKKARESKHLTLSDVSDVTAINSRFLEAIEQGNTSILPAPYIRAFIREYAKVVGLDPVEVLRRFDQGPAGTSVPEEPVEHTAEPAPPPAPEPAAQREQEARPLSARISQYAILLIVLLALGVGFWNLWRTPGRLSEIPVSGTAPESAPSLTAGDTVKSSSTIPAVRPAVRDSLTLSGKATDSVWVMVQIDNLPPRDFLMKAGHRFSWKAAEKFLVTLGNAGGVELTLNNKRLAPLGKKGTIVRGAEITRRLLTSP